MSRLYPRSNQTNGTNEALASPDMSADFSRQGSPVCDSARLAQDNEQRLILFKHRAW